MDISLRLREERERLGLSQEEMGVLGGVKKMAQWRYEQGTHYPDAGYLLKVAQVGADTNYILTGQRTKPVESVLTPRAQALLKNYEAADEAGRRIIEGTASMAAQQKQSVKKRA